jgi:MoxR-like ATPase
VISTFREGPSFTAFTRGPADTQTGTEAATRLFVVLRPTADTKVSAETVDRLVALVRAVPDIAIGADVAVRVTVALRGAIDVLSTVESVVLVLMLAGLLFAFRVVARARKALFGSKPRLGF